MKCPVGPARASCPSCRRAAPDARAPVRDSVPRRQKRIHDRGTNSTKKSRRRFPPDVAPTAQAGLIPIEDPHSPVCGWCKERGHRSERKPSLASPMSSVLRPARSPRPFGPVPPRRTPPHEAKAQSHPCGGPADTNLFRSRIDDSRALGNGALSNGRVADPAPSLFGVGCARRARHTANAPLSRDYHRFARRPCRKPRPHPRLPPVPRDLVAGPWGSAATLSLMRP